MKRTAVIAGWLPSFLCLACLHSSIDPCWQSPSRRLRDDGSSRDAWRVPRSWDWCGRMPGGHGGNLDARAARGTGRAFAEHYIKQFLPGYTLEKKSSGS
jgi:hypothetical protein